MQENNAKILLLGPPASGKSTLFKNIKDHYPNIGHFAVRLFFEAEKRKKSDWSRRAIPNKDGWLPDAVVAEAAEMHMNRYIEQGMVIEGFPASKVQAELFNDILERTRIKMNGLVYLTVDREVSVERALQRMVCMTCDNGVNHVESLHGGNTCPLCGTELTKRHDDNREKFLKRLQIHHDNIEEVLDVLNLPIHRVDGTKDKEAVFKEVMDFIKIGV